MSESTWASDVPVSIPVPLGGDEGLVPMFGFTWTKWGLRHDLTASDAQRLSVPPLAPHRPAEVVRGDADLDDGRG